MAAEMFLLSLSVLILAFIISALPLYLAVAVLGGDASLLKSIIITLATGILFSITQAAFRYWGGLIALLLLIWIYHEVFRLKWPKAVLAWILQLVFITLFYYLALFIFGFLGISLVSIMF